MFAPLCRNSMAAMKLNILLDAHSLEEEVRRVGSIVDRTMIRADQMKDFSNASFPPETIDIMKDAMEAAIATLPDPVSSTHLQSIAETIQDPIDLSNNN
jgi:hypothetical protein